MKHLKQSQNEKGSAVVLLVICFTAAWFSASSQNAIASQKLVREFTESLEERTKDNRFDQNLLTMSVLTALQICAGFFIGIPLYIIFIKIIVQDSISKTLSVSKHEIVVGCLHFFGCLCTNMGFSYGSAALVQVIKLLEPIETFVLVAMMNVFYSHQPHGITLSKAVSVFLIVSGASLLLLQKDISASINHSSVAFALMSGLTMSIRNVIQKSYKAPSKGPEEDCISSASKGLTNFVKINAIAAVPAFFFIVVSEHTFKQQGNEHTISALIWETKDSCGVHAVLFHAVYNLASISVLSLVSAQTHSLLNVGKRIVNVIMAAMAFQIDWKMSGVFGLLVAFMGGLIYSGICIVPRRETEKKSILIVPHREIKKKSLLLRGTIIIFVIFVSNTRTNISSLHIKKNQPALRIKSSSQISLFPLSLKPLEKGGMCKKMICLEKVIDKSLFTKLTGEMFSNKTKTYDDTLCLQMGAQVGMLFGISGMPLTSSHLESTVQTLKESVGADIQYEIVERKKIAMLGFYGSSEEDISRRIEQVDNKGNFLWQYGATSLMDRFTMDIYDASGPVENGTVALVIATANALFMDENSTHSFKMLKNVIANMKETVLRFDLPTIMLGIGVQVKFLDYDDISKIVLYDHQRDFLKEIGKRHQGRSIAVRGDVTETACINAGVTECLSMGCPTLTISRDMDLGNSLKVKWDTVKSKLLKNENTSTLKVGLTLPALMAGRDSMFELILHMLLSIHNDHDCYFILQAPYDKSQLLNYAKEKILEKKIMIFSDVDEWIAFAGGMDIIVSTRIHGGMAGVAAGVPTVIVPTDYRILELVQAMKLPVLPLEKVQNNKYSSLLQVMNDTQVDFKALEVNRRSKLREYKRMLEGIGLKIEPSLLPIVGLYNQT